VEWELKAGEAVDGWTLTELLGKGGNGEVWVAEHPALGRAALKLLKLKFQNQEQKRYLRFCDEATMHGKLAERNSGVLPFLGCSLPESPTLDTPAWLATPVAIPVRKALEGRPLREAVEAVASVADTLTALHEQGVSHRDIKPDNLFKYVGRWVVGDFGLVDYPDKESLTETGERLGPFHYLAPEMHDEANRSDGRKADVYSLGKTLWVLATEQRVPPPGELRADNIQLNIRAYRTDPRTHQLDLLIERATKHDLALRPRMTEYAAEMRAWLTMPKEGGQPDLTDVLARIRTLAPLALRSAVDRTKLMESAKRLEQELRTGLSAIAKQLAGTGLSDGSVVTVFPPDSFFEQQLATGYISGTNFLCNASLPVGSREVRLSCTVIVRAYHDGTAQFCAGYRVGDGVARDRVIGPKRWACVLDSARQTHAVAELFTSLNESLDESLTALAEWGENVATQG
jgi:serine/threonine protein kinase